MKLIFAVTYLCAIVILFIHIRAGMSCADETIKHLSLGYGSVAQTTDDPKAPPPPSLLTAKYGFKGLKGFIPYVGTGLAYTLQTDDKTGNKTKINAGIAGQAGFSYLLGVNSLLNIDYNYLHLSPDIKQGGTPPQSVGIGVKIQF